jgi:hypothetical protein
MTTSISGTGGITFPDGSVQPAAASPYVNKNRIINGDFRIDQRNAGASVTVLTSTGYTLDRFDSVASASSKYSVQQNAASVTPPVGFTNYYGVTSLSAYTVGSGDYFFVRQKIEGYNVSDLGWGTANAKTITLSFWVRSSLTGTFGGALTNSGDTRSYPFSYTISVANTWEFKTLTIAGDTSGTWLTTNGVGIEVRLGYGTGSTYSGTSGAWVAGNIVQPTGTVSVVGTNGATFYITGVQLEIGTSATPFERRLYNQELANCQRYYQQFGGDTSIQFIGIMQATAATSGNGGTLYLPVQMRTVPTLTSSTLSDFSVQPAGGGAWSVTSLSLTYSSTTAQTFTIGFSSGGATAGQGLAWYCQNSSARLKFSSEL